MYKFLAYSILGLALCATGGCSFDIIKSKHSSTSQTTNNNDDDAACPVCGKKHCHEHHQPPCGKG